MSDKFAILVTTINAPTESMRALAAGSVQHGHSLYAVGDTKSPSTYDLQGCQFLDVAAQQASGFELGRKAPTRSYARKAIGYLAAMRDGHQLIVETDDDNAPTEDFWLPRSETIRAPRAEASEWINVYAWFTDNLIWPRGYPLDRIQAAPPDFSGLPIAETLAPIQQGLADGDPDVDAVYRLVLPLPQHFRRDRKVLLGRNAWCPFNSQNTTWFRRSFPLLYLPFTCTMRMTDIYRGFVAQRVAWENRWSMLFHGPSVFQDRNVHDYMQDFRQEIDGYLNYHEVRRALEGTKLKGGESNLPDDLMTCYETMIALGALKPEEREFLAAWRQDITTVWAPAAA